MMSVRSSAERPVEDFGSTRWFQLFEDCGAAAHGGLVENFNGPWDGQHRDNCRGFGQRQLVKQFGQVGRGQVGDHAADADEAFIQAQMDAFQ